ncbi:hypothetical protein [Cesiribacter sp. SM1]|uniref:hypothetical protein n=1 Tax=Cesiribacter sp. SM1 TaxID=2861196 RepID=UPI001CD5B256|nr:hypothetical protein [Cesiribacter sp. SM1]
MRYLFLLIVFSATFWACQPEEACISSATNNFVVEFLPVDNPDLTTDDRYFRRISTLIGNTEYVFWANDTTPISRFLLILDPNRDTTTFVFRHLEAEGQEPLPNDSLVLTYQRRYRLITPDCPLEVSFDQLRLVKTTFDTALVVNSELLEPSDSTDVQVFD